MAASLMTMLPATPAAQVLPLESMMYTNGESGKKRKRDALGERWDAEVDEDWDGWEPPEEADEADDPMEIEGRQTDTEDEDGEEEQDDEKGDPTYIPKWDRG